MERSFRLYFTSDIHGCFSPIDYISGKHADTGLANCMSHFNHDGNTVIVDGGDTLQGSPFTSYLYSERPAGECVPARVMNLAGYDLVTLGNHDFNYGKAEVERYLEELDAKCLCANVKGVKGVEDIAVITLNNGLRIGFTGITSDFSLNREKPENLAGVQLFDAFGAAEASLGKLKALHCDVTVCIYHGGYENDLSTGKLLSDTGENQGYRICRELDFDVLLCGHQHMAKENLSLFGTHTCQVSDKASHFIELTATVADDGTVAAHSQLVAAGDLTGPEAGEYLREIEKDVSPWLDSPLGELDTALLPGDHLDMAINGSLIANFFNQVQLEASKADISVTSLANTVRGFEKQVTIRDVVSSYVFPNNLITLRVNRAILKSALERSAEYFTMGENGKPEISAGFLRPIEQHFSYDYFSGIEVEEDITRNPGDRVVSIRYQGQELGESTELLLCMTNYRATGAGGYECYIGCPVICEQATEISQLIIDYISTHKSVIVDKTKWLKVIY